MEETKWISAFKNNLQLIYFLLNSHSKIEINTIYLRLVTQNIVNCNDDWWHLMLLHMEIRNTKAFYIKI